MQTQVKIEEDQYLQNLIEIASFEKEKANQLLIKGEDTSRWRLNVSQGCIIYRMNICINTKSNFVSI